MSQKLMSAEFYKEPSEDESVADPTKISGSRNALLAAKTLLSVVLWVAVLGGSGFMVCRAVLAANQPASYSGHGGHPALSMLSFCMNLVDFKWDTRVEDRIQSNKRPTPPSPDISDIRLNEDPLVPANLDSIISPDTEPLIPPR